MGALQYLTFMRLNIYFVVNRVYQFMHSPTYSHWGVIKHILCYLQGMTTYDLHITRSSSSARHSFTDADWAGSIDDRKSIGGILSSLVKFWFHENQASNTQLLAHPPRLSIKP